VKYEEWKILEGHVDTQYPVDDPEWDGTSWRGYDAGKRLKSTSGWDQNTGTDAVGFTALPGGYSDSGGTFYKLGEAYFWWSSTNFGNTFAWSRYLYGYSDEVSRQNYNKDSGFSVRCLKD